MPSESPALPPMGKGEELRYACLVFRRHAVELHDLSEAEGAAFMLFYPRYPPFEGGPISPKAVRKPVYAPGEITVLRSRLLEALVDRAEG